ncbi:MAG TPA: TerB N-terminal domain-containing protein [Bellilinea sp.]|nr:TerB N-terminal domain-containing protein [Bellilinea sp.]
MARKSSGASGVLIVAALILAALVELIRNYWPALLVIGGIGVAIWLYKKSTAQSPAPQHDGSITLRVSVGSNLDSGASDYSHNSRQKPTVGDGDKLWLPAGKPATVGGYLLNDGLLYVGKGLAASNGWQIEAALIDPSLPVDQNDDDYRVRKLDYWPSYLEASKAARASYLNWLAKGRSDPNADIGYVFMYFYGLERRALVDTASSAAAKAEVPAIVREIERLLAVYGNNYSFRGYASSLLDFLKDDQEYLDCQVSPPPLFQNGELTFAHRLCLGKMSALRNALPSEWALIWLMGDPTTRLKTAAQRCPNEFKRAFIEQYTKEFGAGMLLPQNKTRLKLTHRPASPSFHGQSHFEKHFDLPDVTVLSSPMRKLQAIAESSMAQLDAYSRFLGRNPDKTESADALLELPFYLWPDKYRQPVENVRATIKTAGKPLATKFERLQGLFPDWHEANRQKYQSLSRALAEAGMGIEPDVKFGGKVPSPDAMVVIFSDEDIQSNREPAPEYGAASLTLHLAVSVSVADGEVGDEERQLLLRQLEDWLHLNESARRRLQAHLRLLMAEPPGTKNLKKRIEALPMNARQSIGEFLAQVAKADEEVTPAEVKLLEKIFKMLELDTQSVYSLLHVSVSSPVTVRPSDTSAPGFSIPIPPRPNKAGIELDMDRIAVLHAESEKVSAILGEIFVEETVRVEPEPATEEPEIEVHDSIMGRRAFSFGAPALYEARMDEGRVGRACSRPWHSSRRGAGTHQRGSV